VLKVFIPSKNRAAQLHLLLESLKVNLLDSVSLDIYVLYKSTSLEYECGYQKLIRDSPLSVAWAREENFSDQFKDQLRTSEHICLFTDDCIFYRPYETSIQQTLNFIEDDVWCFSWRLGFNTTQQFYVTKSQQPSLDDLGYSYFGLDYSKDNGFIKWNWKIRNAYENYGYSCSWDGHIYRGHDLWNFCKDHSLVNPRHFESIMAEPTAFRQQITRKMMVASQKSHVIVNTVNCCQDPPIGAGLFFPTSLEEMNNRYLSDYVIDLNNFDFSDVIGCHDELPVKWRKV